MTKQIQIIFILFFVCNISSLLAGDDPPAWVKNRRSAKYPERYYLQAVGQAGKTKKPEQDRARAQDEARNQIAQQLKVQIASESVALKFESQEVGIYQERTSERIIAATDIVLSGLKLVDDYYDKKKKVYYALAVLDRRIAAKAMRNEIKILDEAAQTAMESADSLMQSGQPRQAILTLRRAYQQVQAVQERRRILAILASASNPAFEGKSLTKSTDVLEKLGKAAASIRLELYAEQTIILGYRSLPFVIKGRAFSGESTVNNLAVKTVFRQGRGNALVLDRTQNGDLRILVNNLGPAPHGQYTIEVFPDLTDLRFKPNRIGAEAWNDVLEHSLYRAPISFTRLDVNLEDYSAGLAADLSANLLKHSSEFRLAMGNITFAETGAAGRLISYLKEKIKLELSRNSGIQVLSKEEIIQGMNRAKRSYQASKRPDLPEVLAELVDASGTLVGRYWDRSDILEFNLQIVQRNSRTILSAASMKLPMNLVPADLPYLPANYTNFSRAKQLDEGEREKSDLQVDVWVDQGAGATYRAGEKLVVFVRASQDCYLYLIYHDAGSNDILIFPNARQGNHRILGGVIYQVPDARDTFDFTIQPPFGSELLKAVVSEKPLPELRGKVLANGLKLLKGSYRDHLVRLRGIAMEARGYAEGSCVVTTME